jgi:energy-coupling factor transport system permease protein
MIKYINVESIIHKINPIVKYLFELIIILMIPFMDLKSYIVLFLVLIVTVFFSNVGMLYFHRKLTFIFYLLIFLILTSFLFPIFTLSNALLISFRIYLMFGIIIIIVMTTRLSSLIKFFNILFSKVLSKEHTRKLTFIILLIIKFIPLLLIEVDHLMLSFKTRGMYFNQGSVKKRIKFINLFITSFIERIESLIDEFDLIIHAKNIEFNNMDNLKSTQGIKIIDIFVIILLFVIMLI